MRLRTLLAASLLLAPVGARAQEQIPPDGELPDETGEALPEGGVLIDPVVRSAPIESEILVALKSGGARIKGDIGDARRAPVRGFLFMLQSPPGAPWTEDSSFRRALGGFELRLAFDAEYTRVEQKGALGAVPPGEDLSLGLWSLNGLFCALARFPVQVCPYVGIGQVDLQDVKESGDRYDQTRGVSPYGLLVPYTLRLGSVGVATGLQISSYTIRQVTDGERQRSTTTALTAFLGAAF